MFQPNNFASSVRSTEIGKLFILNICCFSWDRTVIFHTVVSEESVRLIQKMLSNSVAARWYQMGVVMGVPPSDLEIIKESPEYHGAGEREAAMLKAWLERGILPRTWQVGFIVCIKDDVMWYCMCVHLLYTTILEKQYSGTSLFQASEIQPPH